MVPSLVTDPAIDTGAGIEERTRVVDELAAADGFGQ